MSMNDALSYWSPLCGLVQRLRCWVRVSWRAAASTVEGHWGQLLILPTEGYLEGPGGPIPLRDVQWVEVSTSLIKGGIAGRPLQILDVKDEILAGLRGTQLCWELRESTWSIERVFKEEPVRVFRIANPFFMGSRS